jgi:hypothetical protein
MLMRPSLRLALIVFLACTSSACELVADFDRDKIPEPPRDAATFDDAAVNPPTDAATDGNTPDDDAGGGSDASPDEDAGR